MRSVLFTLTIFLAIAIKKCTEPKQDKIPACIQKRIDEIKKEARWNPPAEVYEYSYNGKTVYYFSSDCCDNFNSVVDENCNAICSPSGGYTGKGDGKCKDFNTTAKKIRLVWKDERTK